MQHMRPSSDPMATTNNEDAVPFNVELDNEFTDDVDIIRVDKASDGGVAGAGQRGGRCQGVCGLITIEPSVCLFMLAGGLVWTTSQAMLYRKVCLARYSDALCDALQNDSYKAEEDVVQGVTSHWMLVMNVCFQVPVCLVVLLYGALSDHISRKVALLLPVVGSLLATCVYALNAWQMQWHVGWLVPASLLNGLFGGWVTCLVANFSYLSHVTSVRARTVRVMAVEVTLSASMAISVFFSGILLDLTSFLVVSLLAVLFLVLNLVYIGVWIPEPPPTTPDDGPAVAAVTEPRSVRWLFSLRRIIDALACAVRKREGHTRQHILIILAILATATIAFQARDTVGYLYVKRQPLSWSQSRFGEFVGYTTAVCAVSAVILVPLLQRVMHFRETTIMLMALLSASMCAVLFGLSTRTWMLFAGALVGAMGEIHYTCLRSLISQMVDTNELGQIFAVFGCLQSISDLIGSAIYNDLYPVSLPIWNGLCFLIGGAMIGSLPISLTIWLHRSLKGGALYRKLNDAVALRGLPPDNAVCSDDSIGLLDGESDDEDGYAMEDDHLPSAAP